MRRRGRPNGRGTGRGNAGARSSGPESGRLAPGPPSMKTPADTGGGGGSTCGGDLLPRETGRKNFGRGLEGFRGARSIPRPGDPQASGPVASRGASRGAACEPRSRGSSRSAAGAYGCRSVPAADPATRAPPGIAGVAASLPVVLSRCTPGAGTCAGRGGGFASGGLPAMLGSALSGPARDLHGGACPAPGERGTGWPSAGREWGAREWGPGRAAPPPSVSALPRPHGVAKFQSAARTFEKGTFCFRP